MMRTQAAKRLHAREGHISKQWPSDQCECLFSRRLQKVENEAALMTLLVLRSKLEDGEHVWTRENLDRMVEVARREIE